MSMPEDKPEHKKTTAPATPEERKKLEKWNRWYTIKQRGKQVWRFIWYDDSLASWLVNVVLAFIIIKFIVYPVLGFALGTGYPIVAVVSSSMEHPGTFQDWWTSVCQYPDNSQASQATIYSRMGIDQTMFSSFRFTNGFDRGDLMVLTGAQTADVGNILVYSAPGFSDPIIHRIIAKRTDVNGQIVYDTKGDHNCGQGSYEQGITPDRVLGKAVLRVPWLGWIKIGFVNLVMYVKCMFTPTSADCALWRQMK